MYHATTFHWFVHVGVFYYQLGNISPQYRSLLRSIQLVAIAESAVIAKYGSNKILEPFMADIHKLEQVKCTNYILVTTFNDVLILRIMALPLL